MDFIYQTEGYLKDSAYTANLLSFMREYTDKFPTVEEVRLQVDEVWVDRQEYYTRKNKFEYSSDGKVLVINTYQMFSHLKGKKQGMTMPYEFYQNLRFLFDKAVEEHQIRLRDNGQ